MSAQLIRFPEPNKGNGALEIVRDFFKTVYPALVISRIHSSPECNAAAIPDGDFFLTYMGEAGYKIVHLEEKDR